MEARLQVCRVKWHWDCMKDSEMFCRSLDSHVEHIVYVFEGFRLDAGRRQLSSSGGVVVPLNSRAMEALVMLVARAGELVTKRQLLEGVWPAAVVEDNNINQCVLAIRKALGETAGANRFIMTVPGRGYRFVAPVTAQKRESLEYVAEPEAPVSSHRLPATRALAAAAILLGVPCAVGVLYLRHGSATLPGEAVNLVVQLREPGDQALAPSASLLMECLRQRPDLHLQIEVQVVGTAHADPVWTGEFVAGADDVVSAVAPKPAADHNACHQLTAKQATAAVHPLRPARAYQVQVIPRS